MIRLNAFAAIGAFLGCAVCLIDPGSARADFTFVHVTDSHFTASAEPTANAAKCAAMFREIRALNPRPAFVVHTGDVTESGVAAEYALFHKTKVESLGTDIPEYEAPGNHDSRWNPLGKEGFIRGTKEPLWQSWDYEKVHFVLMDSTVLLQHWGHFDQRELDWLAKDLARVGTERPIVFGFHHFFLHGSMIDNYAAFLKVVAPYNVRLYLIGHGHSDTQWSINGVPAVMAKGLYQGSYNLVQVQGDTLRVLRRTAAHPNTTAPVLTTSLLRPKTTPVLKPQVTLQGGMGTVTLHTDGLPVGARVAFTAAGKVVEMSSAGGRGDYSATFPTDGWTPGVYEAVVTATDTAIVPDTIPPVYAATVSLTVPPPAGKVGPVWTADLGSEVQSHLVRAGDLLYVPTMGGTLFALDPATGKTRWQYKTDGSVFSVPLVADGTVYFGSADHNVYALDANTGKPLWKRQTGGGVFAGAAKAGDIVCIVSADRNAYGLDGKTGAVRWTQPVESLYQSQAITDGERFYLGGWDRKFRALDAKTGAPVWTNTFGRSFYFSPAIGSPAFGAGRVYVTSNDGLMHAMDAATGKVLWETPVLSLGYSGPLLQDGRIYNASLTDKGIVFSFDAATGEKLWETPTGSVIYDSSCASSGGVVYVGDVDGAFSALRMKDGALLWQYRLGAGDLLASPATDSARVYIGNLSGRVYAFPAGE